MVYEYVIAPFADFGFMRRALVASLALSIGGSAIGVFLILRRMSLMGDAMSHAILPGAALGYLAFGWVTMGQVLSLPLILLGLYWCWKSHSSPTLMPQPAAEAAK